MLDRTIRRPSTFDGREGSGCSSSRSGSPRRRRLTTKSATAIAVATIVMSAGKSSKKSTSPLYGRRLRTWSPTWSGRALSREDLDAPVEPAVHAAIVLNGADPKRRSHLGRRAGGTCVMGPHQGGIRRARLRPRLVHDVPDRFNQVLGNGRT